MAKDPYPLQWAGRQAVMVLPGHIDVSVAGQIRDQLLSTINRGADPLIVDMTATASCDHADVDAIMRAYQRSSARAGGRHPVRVMPGWASAGRLRVGMWVHGRGR